jgi:hypothetical protein
VGQTSQPLARRWSAHQSRARKGSTYHLHNAIRKYGADAFTVEIKGTFDTKAELDAAEQAAICVYNAHYWDGGYNLTFGGEGCSMPISEQQKIKMSKAHLGKRHSAESIRKIKEAAKNRPPRSEAHCRSISKAATERWKRRRNEQL